MNFDILKAMDLSTLLTIIGALTLGTNIITEIIKQFIPKVPGQILATIIAIALTVAAFFTYASISSLTVEWYMVMAAIICGFFVSYAAQFGFDKLKELINKYKQ